jgi:formate hydrogenlyase transcriptional activator
MDKVFDITGDRLRLSSAAMENDCDAIVLLDEKSRICGVNRAAGRLLGFSEKELLNSPYERIQPCEDTLSFKDFWSQLLRENGMIFDEYLVGKDGGRIPVRFFANVIEFSNKIYVYMFIHGKNTIDRMTRKPKNTDIETEKTKHRLLQEIEYLRNEIKSTYNFQEIITKNQLLIEALHKVSQVASTDATVLITGETGTGKELIARAIHNNSSRRTRPMIKVNCAALPANLIESELFGHEKGAFTGAYARKIGRFELADNTTLFLDEIGDLPMELQVKLLQVIQEGMFERVGGSKTIRTNTRIIAATNRDLEKAVKNGTFRDDFYYRLNVFPIHLPTLRQRKGDITLLASYFIKKYSAKIGKTVHEIPQIVMDTLQAYNWPGNVRELENVIERAVIISRGSTLELSGVLPGQGPAAGESLFRTMEEVERSHILKVLEYTNNKVGGERGAAKILGLKRTTLIARMQKLNIVRGTL